MQTLFDFGLEVQKVREAVDSIEVKGSKNASLLLYAYNKCNDIIKAINEVASQQNPPSGQNGKNVTAKEGEDNGESNSGATS